MSESSAMAGYGGVGGGGEDEEMREAEEERVGWEMCR